MNEPLGDPLDKEILEEVASPGTDGATAPRPGRPRVWLDRVEDEIKDAGRPLLADELFERLVEDGIDSKAKNPKASFNSSVPSNDDFVVVKTRQGTAVALSEWFTFDNWLAIISDAGQNPPIFHWLGRPLPSQIRQVLTKFATAEIATTKQKVRAALDSTESKGPARQWLVSVDDVATSATVEIAPEVAHPSAKPAETDRSTSGEEEAPDPAIAKLQRALEALLTDAIRTKSRLDSLIEQLGYAATVDDYKVTVDEGGLSSDSLKQQFDRLKGEVEAGILQLSGTVADGKQEMTRFREQTLQDSETATNTAKTEIRGEVLRNITALITTATEAKIEAAAAKAAAEHAEVSVGDLEAKAILAIAQSEGASKEVSQLKGLKADTVEESKISVASQIEEMKAWVTGENRRKENRFITTGGAALAVLAILVGTLWTVIGIYVTLFMDK